MRNSNANSKRLKSSLRRRNLCSDDFSRSYPAYNKIRIVGLGMAALDILLRSKDLPTWEHGVHLSGIAIEGGGPVATALVAAQRLGVQTGFVGTYGSDRLGAIKKNTLVEEGVDVSRMVQRPGPENQNMLVNVNEASGERIFSSARVDSPLLAASELDRDYLTAAEFLHLDGFHAEAAQQAAGWMHAAGKRVMLDGSSTRSPISPAMQALVGTADILICGSGFGPSLTGKSDLWEAGQAILEMGPSIVVQTEGKDGSYTVTRQERFHIPAFEIDVVDTTGAGDVFHGAYLVGLLQGWDLRQAAQFSAAVAAIKCTQLSGRRGIPCFEAALAFLRQQGIEIG